MTKIQLDNNFAQVTSITLNKTEDGECFEGLNISHTHCQAQISLYGGQVLKYKPTGHKDVLWLSHRAHYQPEKAIRGGIPICWPWFGAHDKQEQFAMHNSEELVKVVNHGFARQLVWKVETIQADEKGVTLILSLTGQDQHPLWPNEYKLTQTLFLGQHFKQTLTMTNLSKENAYYSAALHSYFRVSNPENIDIANLTGVIYHDKLTDKSNKQQQIVSCVGEIDREYHSHHPMTLVDSQWQRQIHIKSEHCQQWVLWNPGTELANKMLDIHSQGEQEYVCLEAANTNWQSLPAGATVSISQEITVTTI